MHRVYLRFGQAEVQRLLVALTLWAILLVGASGALPALAQSSDVEQQVREIGAELRCPVCQNLSVADSPSPLAVEMRGVIRQKLLAGESREEITRFFVERYGEGILLNPPRQGFTLLVWLGAVAAVTAGAGVLATRVRSALRGKAAPAQLAANNDPSPGEQDRYEALLDAELARYKRGEA